MGRPIDTTSTIVRMADIAKLQNTEQHRDEAQRQQFALTLQQEAARKETQVQNTPKSESLEIHKKIHNKEKQKTCIDRAIFNKAKLKTKIELCNNIINGMLKNDCLKYFIKQGATVDDCDKIPLENSFQNLPGDEKIEFQTICKSEVILLNAIIILESNINLFIK